MSDNDLIRRGEVRELLQQCGLMGNHQNDPLTIMFNEIPAAQVAVRDLEWDETSEKIPKPAWVSATGFGRWFIVLDFIAINHAVYRIHGLDYQTIEAAKAAAQADYEARIRSALIAAPAPDPAQIRADALREAARTVWSEYDEKDASYWGESHGDIARREKARAILAKLKGGV